MWFWELLTFVSGMYVLLGLWVNAVATASGNWELMSLALIIYVLNLPFYWYAKSKLRV